MALLVNHFNFKRDGGSVLITNDAGQFMFLDEVDFQTLVRDPASLRLELARELEARLFLSSQQREIFAGDASLRVRDQKSYLLEGTKLHIFVLTRRCNQRCVYCQASACSGDAALSNMTPEIAERAVHIALQSPSRSLSFEFQGGEPTLNFDTLRHIVEYTERCKGDRQIGYSVVTNLASVDNAKLAYLAEHGITVTTSLDGPEDLHVRNRPYTDGTSFALFVRNLERARNAGCGPVGVIQTTTRDSLGRAREIVNAYVDLGFKSVFIRPLTPLGTARASWQRIGYTPQEFLAFYAECLGYILELALQGVDIRELHASLLLKKIFNRPTNFMELRSPCGAAIGQLAYNYDGTIYPCDEGRMVAEAGDHAFRLGDVFHSGLNDLIASPTARALCVASCLELLPGCSECAYLPYCGTCPVVSYAQHGTLFPQRHGEYRCAIYGGMLDQLFGYLRAEASPARALFEGWVA